MRRERNLLRGAAQGHVEHPPEWCGLRRLRQPVAIIVGTGPYPKATPMHEVTRILSAIEQGDPSAAEQLLPLVYDELRKLAAQKMDLYFNLLEEHEDIVAECVFENIYSRHICRLFGLK